MKSKILVVLVILSLMSLWSGMALAQKKVSILAWWTVRKPIMDYSREQVKKFEMEHPNIDVELVGMPGDAVLRKLPGAVRTKTGPDVCYIDENLVKPMFLGGILQPIPPEVYTEEEIIKMHGPEIVRYKLGGKYYGFPNGDMAAVLFYNPEMLKKYGYSPLDIPDTWDEFIPMAQKMTDLDHDIQGFPVRGKESSLWAALLYQKGGYIFRSEREAMFAGKPGIEAWQFILDLYDKHKVASRTSLSLVEAFGQGKAPFAYNWTWYIGTLKTSYPDIPFGTRVLPTFTGKPPYGSYGPSFGFLVTSTDPKKKDAAWEFWKFTISPDFQKGLCILRGLLPARIEAQDPEIFGKSPYRALAKAATNGVSYSFYPEEVEHIFFGTAMDKIMAGAPIAETLEEAQKEVDEILRKRGEKVWIMEAPRG